MTFPTNPTNGQTTTVNGVLYTYNSTRSAWTVTSSGGSLTSATAVSVTGNVAADYYSGNGSQLTGISAPLSGNLSGNITGNGFAVNSVTVVSATGNITGANVLANTAVVVNGNIVINSSGQWVGAGITIPPSTNTTVVAADEGKYLNVGSNVTINTSTGFASGDAVSIYNNSASSITIVASSVTLRLAGSATTGNRTLAQYGLCTILCVGTNDYVISGAGLT